MQMHDLHLRTASLDTFGFAIQSVCCESWRPGLAGEALLLLELSSGALATSGDPRSVTVAAASCTEAGMWATLALLEGTEARSFLQLQRRPH
jgi:hypothetical protein